MICGQLIERMISVRDPVVRHAGYIMRVGLGSCDVLYSSA